MSTLGILTDMAKRKSKFETSFTVSLSSTLVPKFRDEARIYRVSEASYAELLIDNAVTVDPMTNHDRRQRGIKKLAALIKSLPAVDPRVSHSKASEHFWWIKFTMDREHPLVWHVIQRLGFVLNYFSLDERFDVAFLPVSPPPPMNGGPEFLSWAVEAKKRFVNPETILEALRAELPKRMKSEKEWREYDTND